MTILWKPSKKRAEKSQMHAFMRSRSYRDYSELHSWSVRRPEKFWDALLDFYPLIWEGDRAPACTDLSFESYGWFPNVRLNFAENMLSHPCSTLVWLHESGQRREVDHSQLSDEVASLQAHLRGKVGPGDVLGAYMPNIPETVVSMLAASSLGAAFTSTSCDFGIEGVVDRFEQSRPKVLVAAAGYEYNGKYIDLIPRLHEIMQRLPFVEEILVVDFLDKGVVLQSLPRARAWGCWAKAKGEELTFERLPFAHPLYIMYSSGTTGKPKCIVHSQGGTLLQHIKELGLHSDLTDQKTIFFFTTCGWMMWNWLVSSLFFGARTVLYEGSPSFPSLGALFENIDHEGIHIFGTSPKFLKALEDSDYQAAPGDFASLETLLSTGSPLLPEQFDFVYEKIKKDVLLGSISGGTDIIGCFMLANPLLPVTRGEIQCLGLGMDVAALGPSGKPVTGQEGELVCKRSFPSRPIHFLDDADGAKLKKAYFEAYPGLWHHGDFVRISKAGTVAVFGRSDATLNPGGVRIGTAEIYRQTERLPYIADSLCVGKDAQGDVQVHLYVKMKSGEALTDQRVKEIKDTIRKGTTPRHVPASVLQVSDIPYTRSGKKMELAVARLINGRQLTNIEAVANPECLEQYKAPN